MMLNKNNYEALIEEEKFLLRKQQLEEAIKTLYGLEIKNYTDNQLLLLLDLLKEYDKLLTDKMLRIIK